MTDRELLQQALDALISVWNMDKTTKQVESIQAIRTRLAQPEPEPVAVVGLDMSEVNVYYGSQYCGKKQETKIAVFLKDVLIGTRLYTAPPQRKEWVGLTGEELQEIYQGGGTVHFKLAMAEAKLKEKNT